MCCSLRLFWMVTIHTDENLWSIRREFQRRIHSIHPSIHGLLIRLVGKSRLKNAKKNARLVLFCQATFHRCNCYPKKYIYSSRLRVHICTWVNTCCNGDVAASRRATAIATCHDPHRSGFCRLPHHLHRVDVGWIQKSSSASASS